jgi:hypothetical protein
MTVGKATALAAGFVGAVALGVAIGPTMQDKWHHAAPQTAMSETAPATTPAPAKKTAPVRTRAASATSPKTDAKTDATMAPVAKPGQVYSVPVTAWNPEVRGRVQKVLNRGTDMERAAENFSTAEQFATVAHAAKNTGVPFVVLKDRVLNQKQTLADAINEFKPELDAKAEVARAREEAQADFEI